MTIWALLRLAGRPLMNDGEPPRSSLARTGFTLAGTDRPLSKPSDLTLALRVGRRCAVVPRAIPHEELSRVSSWDSLASFAISPVGLAAAGPIALAVGISATLYAAAALFVLVTLAALAVPSVRNFAAMPSETDAGGN